MTVERALVIGLGRAGAAVGAALAASGVAVSGWSPHAAARSSALEAAGIRVVEPPTAADPANADVIVLAVPDAGIAPIAATLLPALGPTAPVVHLSGSRPAHALPASLGDRRGAAHPLMSLGGADDASRLRGAFFGVDGVGPGGDAATAIALRCGGAPGRVPPEARAAYHAAAVVASNGAFALAHAAHQIAAGAGLDHDALRDGLVHLLAGSADRMRAAAPVDAATGPVVRGDANTLREHLDTLPPGADETALYRAVQALCLDLAERRGLPAPSLAALRHVLYGSDEPPV